ncbi:unnamed protein product [Thelazia callipaeda]|uniref:Apple domain-containing protein n=1 Tax=Thelazia callipaeda TaxID=103827 RepID=A0A0N5CMM8_THECL|nr:unnamed protein product [Thelazia callipaeda]
MIDRVQKECLISKWSPYLITPSRYQSRVVHTDFYQNICISSADQIQDFTAAPPRTTLSISIPFIKLGLPSSSEQIVSTHRFNDDSSNITAKLQKPKEPPLASILYRSKEAAGKAWSRYKPKKRTRALYNGYQSNEDYLDDITDDDDDEDDDDDNDDNDDDDDDDEVNDDVSSEEIDAVHGLPKSLNNEAVNSTNNSGANRISRNSLASALKMKSSKIRSDIATPHHNLHFFKVSRPKNTSSSNLLSRIYPSTDQFVNIINNTVTTTTSTSSTMTTNIMPVTRITEVNSPKISASFFVPVPANPSRWNTTTKDSKLFIEHRNYALNIGVNEQHPDSRQVIRNKLIEQLRSLNGYEQERIKQIGLQDCLYNCILRVAFLCLSVNYDKYSKENSENYDINEIRKCFSICENAMIHTLNGLIVDGIYTPLECLSVCALSRHVYHATCYSVNWFKDTRTCYLHTSKTKLEDLNATTSSDFFLNNCAGKDFTTGNVESSECEDDECDSRDQKLLWQ